MTSRKPRHQKTSAMSPKVTGYHDCGNPPGWTGHLRALHLRCGTARYRLQTHPVFKLTLHEDSLGSVGVP